MSNILYETSFGAIVVRFKAPSIQYNHGVVSDIINKNLSIDEYHEMYKIQEFDTQFFVPKVYNMTFLFRNTVVSREDIELDSAESHGLLCAINEYIDKNSIEFSSVEVRQLHFEYCYDFPFPF